MLIPDLPPALSIPPQTVLVTEAIPGIAANTTGLDITTQRLAQTILPATDGTATFVVPNGNRYDIGGGTLSNDGTNLFHSFQQFDLSDGEIANFLSNPQIQNILGRVVGGNASTINGLIQVMGGQANLFLMNPAGIVFGPNASLNIPGSFTATTASGIGFKDGWFNATGPNQYQLLNADPNRFAFTASQAGSIVNAGNLAVLPGKNLTLLGGTVINTGTLTAPGGTVSVVAVPGEKLVRISQQGMALSLEVEALANQDLEKQGETTAVVTPLPFGPASLPELLTQTNVGHATGITVNADGTLHLTGAGITIAAAPGTAIISGTVDVSIQNPKSKIQNPVGGTINLLGERVALFSAELDASGTEGGGTVRVGGDFQGQGPFFRAEQTIVSEDSKIAVDALEQGDGGQAIVWADQLTRFYGNISAQGGRSSGDGGLVEVSGKELLVFTGNVDASAPLGDAGTLLLDPKDITISDRNAPLATFLNPTAAGSDSFGFAIAGVGNNILIGAPSDDTGAANTGAAYLFDGSTGALLQSFFNPSAQADDAFGTAVAAVGTNVLIGAPLYDIPPSPIPIFNTGRAYLFDSDTGGLLQTFENPSPDFFDEFGAAVAGVGTNALVGAPGDNAAEGTVYLLDSTTGGVLQTFNNPTPPGGNDEFGRSVAAFGSNVLIGSPLDDTGASNAGSAYLFDSNTGGLLQTFNNPTPAVDDEFGRSVAAVGNNVLVGSPLDDTAANNAGAAYVFDSNTGGLLQTLLSPTPTNNGRFGTAVAAVGSHNLVGAPFDTTSTNNAGAAYVFDGNTGQLRQSFTNPIPTGVNQFGAAVASAGTNALVGTPFDDTGATNTGIAYAFPTQYSFSDNPDLSVTIAVDTITNITNTGTDLILQASNDISVDAAIITNNLAGDGGGLTLQAGRSLSIEADITTDNGNLTLIANETTANGVFDAFRDPGDAEISTASGTSLNTGTGSLTAILSTGAGLTHNGSSDIILGNLVAGNVQVENNGSGSGRLVTGDITTNGGAITLSSPGEIATGALNSSASDGNGGNVLVTAGGNIQASTIDAQGGTDGTGGTVAIVADGFVRVTETFLDQNAVLSSISTAGGQGGGEITIQHGGNGITPFTVGDAALNGTAGAITSGEVTLQPLQIFPFTHQEGNIQIISVDRPFNAVDLEQPFVFSELQGSEPLPPLEIDLLQELEDAFTKVFETYLGLDEMAGKTLAKARATLRQIEQETGVKPALIYAFFVPQAIAPPIAPSGTKSLSAAPNHPSSSPQSLSPSQGTPIGQSSPIFQPGKAVRDDDRLELVLVTAEGTIVRRQVAGASRKLVLAGAGQLLSQVTDRRRLHSKRYLPAAQQMYRWLLAPLEEELQSRGINNLVFIPDEGLRSVPLAAMYDGQGFAVERYSIGLMPSLSLTDTRYVNVKTMQVLAMGTETFPAFPDQETLWAVPAELNAIATQLWPGQAFLNENFTLKNLHKARKSRPIGILHLATHTLFQPGAPENSYIYFRDEKVSFDQLRQAIVGNSAIELLVLSSCRTALGDRDAELGFAGLAVQVGVKSAMGSLWHVSDEGTFALMTSFYEHLKTAPIKAAALQQAQQAMLRGEVRLQNGQLITQTGRFPLSPALADLENVNLAHPYYWSSFTMIGNPW